MNCNFDSVCYEVEVGLFAQMLPLLEFPVLDRLCAFDEIDWTLVCFKSLVVVWISAFNDIRMIFLEHH